MSKLFYYILLDKYIGGIVINTLSFFKSFFKHDSLYTSYDKNLNLDYIIIFKFLGIGSITRSLNLIYEIKLKFPNAKIIFITFNENKNFIKIIKIIDKAIYIEKNNLFLLIKSSIICFVKLYCLGKKSMLIDLEVHSNFSKLFIFFLKSKLKLGFYYVKKNYIFDKSFFFDRLLFIEKNYNQIIKFFQITPNNNIKKLNLLNIENDKVTIYSKLNKINIKKSEKFFIINVNASDFCIERKWSIINFQKLIEKLLISNYKIILIGIKSENNNIKNLISKFSNYPNQIFNFAGITTIGELLVLLKNFLIVFVTNDSGPLHLATISRCATISLWGPGIPKSYAEEYPNHRIIYKQVYCSPCIYFHIKPPCGGNNICMKKIGVDEVYNECIDLINKL